MAKPATTTTDIAIIGGGITGCSAAWYLASAGADTLLLEAGELNTEASGSNAGSLHAQIPQDTFLELGDSWAADFAPTLAFLRASIELWSAADKAFNGQLEVRITGGLMLASSEKQLRDIERKAEFERRAGTPAELLDQKAVHAIAPYLAPGIIGGSLCSIEGKASPLLAAPAFARAAQAAGASIRRHTRLLAAERRGSRYRLQTTRGEVDAAKVVIAAGASSAPVARLFDNTRLPLQSAPIQVCVTEPLAPLVRHLLYYARAPLTMKQTLNGTVLIGGGWPARLDARGRPVPDPRSLSQNLGLALEVVPSLASVSLMRTWAATVNGTQDWKPVIGELPGAPGVYLGYVPWMGFTAGPAAGKTVASLARGLEPELGVDVSVFQPA